MTENDQIVNEKDLNISIRSVLISTKMERNQTGKGGKPDVCIIVVHLFVSKEILFFVTTS